MSIMNETIILAIAEIKTYPTLERFLTERKKKDLVPYDEQSLTLLYQETKDIAEIALLNGYKNK